MIIKEKYLEQDYSNLEYWDGVYKAILSNRNEYEKWLEGKSFISLSSVGQEHSQRLRENEKVLFTSKMGFARGQYVKNDEGELFYVVSNRFSGGVVLLENFSAMIYPVEGESLEVIEKTPSWRLFSSSKAFGVYSKHQTVYHIDEKKNRYENYTPVEVII